MNNPILNRPFYIDVLKRIHRYAKRKQVFVHIRCLLPTEFQLNTYVYMHS